MQFPSTGFFFLFHFFQYISLNYKSAHSSGFNNHLCHSARASSLVLYRNWFIMSICGFTLQPKWMSINHLYSCSITYIPQWSTNGFLALYHPFHLIWACSPFISRFETWRPVPGCNHFLITLRGKRPLLDWFDINSTTLTTVVRLSSVMASLVLTDSYKQAMPSSPPQIRRGQGKWWMTSPLSCQGLLVLHWIVPQRPPSSSLTTTSHLECDMNFLGCCWLFWKPKPF